MKHKKRTARAFVANIPSRKQMEDQTIEHVKAIAVQALNIALELYKGEGKKPDIDEMLIFIICVMVSLELDKEIEDIISFCTEYGEEFRAMSTLLWLLFDLGLTMPEGFPYSIEDFKQSAKQKEG